MTSASNRAKRVGRRAKQIRNELQNLDARIMEIEKSDKLDQPVKDRMVKKVRESVGPLNSQLTRLQDRAEELGDVEKQPRAEEQAGIRGVWKLPRTDFPESDLGRRKGRASRAWRAVRASR